MTIQLKTIKETCEMLAISEPTIWRLLDAGKIKAFRVGDQVRFSEEAIKEFLENNCYTRNSNKRGKQRE